MKAFGILASLFLAGSVAYSATNSERAHGLILSADRAVLFTELQTKEKGVETRDRDWMGRFAEALADIPLEDSTHVFLVGAMTVHFMQGDKQVLSVAAITPKYLRIQSEKGGADFIVAEQACKRVGSLILEKNKANQSSEPTLSSVTPPAGQESRPR
jgi:hypothetical protein